MVLCGPWWWDPDHPQRDLWRLSLGTVHAALTIVLAASLLP